MLHLQLRLQLLLRLCRSQRLYLLLRLLSPPCASATLPCAQEEHLCSCKPATVGHLHLQRPLMA